jgi:D-3-phosphoglycerate dehydrogenase
MKNILTFNNISEKGLTRFAEDQYQVGPDVAEPNAVMLRSQKLHDWELPETVRAIGRAGAGTNNIPVDRMTDAGVVVFNAPGANANAVKELVVAGMLMAVRNIFAASEYTKQLTSTGETLEKEVEAGKKQFGGSELPGKVLGVIGLGAIGVRVANAAHSLGMKVIGFDPHITIENAWQLTAAVEKMDSIEALIANCDFISLHVPLIDDTRGLINAARLAKAKPELVVLNFARGPIVDEEAILQALDSGQIAGYVNDFPTEKTVRHQKILTLPHLGASTVEAEDNCAIMIAEQLQDYLENGNITNSVNFPTMKMPRTSETARLVVVNKNQPGMIEKISAALAKHQINIVDMLNRSRGNIACTLLDIDTTPEPALRDTLREIDGVIRAHYLP